MLCQIVEACLADPKHILPLFTALGTRLDLAKATVQGMDLAPEQRFRSTSSVASLDEDWVIVFCAQHSGCTVQQLMQAKAFDAQSPGQLLTFLTGLPPHFHLMSQMSIKAVATRVMEARVQSLGDRGKSFLAPGGWSESIKALQWRRGCYDVEFDADAAQRLKAIMHIPTQTKVPVAQSHINSSWILENNWNDHAACFSCPPMPAVKLAVFFGKLQGPHSVRPVTARNKEWLDLVDKCYKDWEQTVRAAQLACSTSSSSSLSAVEVQSALREYASQKRQDDLESLRERAAKTLAAKRAKRAIEFAT